jgi:hypothetical protein
VFTSSFTHLQLPHLLLNAFGLWATRRCEWKLGSVSYLATTAVFMVISQVSTSCVFAKMLLLALLSRYATFSERGQLLSTSLCHAVVVSLSSGLLTLTTHCLSLAALCCVWQVFHLLCTHQLATRGIRAAAQSVTVGCTGVVFAWLALAACEPNAAPYPVFGGE